MAASNARPRIAIVGCGDIALRRYLPTLELVAAEVELVACCDTDRDRATIAACRCRPWADGVRAVSRIADAGPVDGVFNLTPPSVHAEVTGECLAAGCHVFSEKPLALDPSAGRALIAAAADARRLLLCAPAVMATTRFRWLEQVIGSGRLGRVTVACAQLANLGPADWPEYDGDVRAYYGAGLGPAIDQGIYLLHALTGLLGRVRRVHAFQSTTMPERVIRCRRREGERLRVSAPDVVLLQLDFGGGTLAQALSSYAVPATRAPLLEIHAERGSVVIAEQPPLTDHGPVEVYARDPELGLEGWLRELGPTPTEPDPNSLIAAGALHFVDCLRGLDEPRLGAEHALHVLEVLRTAEESAASGRALAVPAAGG